MIKQHKRVATATREEEEEREGTHKVVRAGHLDGFCFLLAKQKYQVKSPEFGAKPKKKKTQEVPCLGVG